MKAMHGNNNNILGFAIGAITGFVQYFASVETEIISRMFEAGVTAFLCGMLGMAGKELVIHLIRKYKSK